MTEYSAKIRNDANDDEFSVNLLRSTHHFTESEIFKILHHNDIVELWDDTQYDFDAYVDMIIDVGGDPVMAADAWNEMYRGTVDGFNYRFEICK